MRKSIHLLILKRPRGRFGRQLFEARQDREHPFPKSAESPYFLYRSDAELKAHSSYSAAKSGSTEAAIRLIGDVALPLIAKLREEDFPSSCIYVAPHALEAQGENAIPQVLAMYLHHVLDGEVDESIVQTTKVFHTGADPMERINLRARFSGYVVRGGRYVLVDDVTTMGGTLAELANYIQAQRGDVVAAIVLVCAGRSGRLVAPRKVILELERRYGDEIRKIFGIAAHALTADEAGYLIGFRTVDEIRNRRAKAEQETYLRLGSKGIQLDESEGQVGNVGSQRRPQESNKVPSRTRKPRLK
ncbi:conjugal transfer protein TraN [Cupriavidus sp. NPDC089707]|uniref:conjugal transfer protein TraN n=1 Tax=Cupriavidus sp. NPDC089707 TaxID=3363963 RepID=UPI003805F3A2